MNFVWWSVLFFEAYMLFNKIHRLFNMIDFMRLANLFIWRPVIGRALGILFTVAILACMMFVKRYFLG